MKDTMFARIAVSYFLFLTIHILLPANSFVSEAQSQSATRSLEGTQWQALIQWRAIDIKTFDAAEYVFGKQGKIDYRYISVADIEVDIVVPATDLRLKDTYKGDIRTARGTGRYEQSGTSIHLEFPDHTIDAILKGDVMEGFITIKETNERGLWDAKIVSRVRSNQSATSENNEEKYQELMYEARQFEEQKNYAQAIEKYTAAIRLNPSEGDKFNTYRKRGNAHFNLKRYRDAIADYDVYIKQYEYLTNMKPSAKGFSDIDAGQSILSGVYNSRGFVKKRISDNVGACEDFRKACKLSSTMCESSKGFCN